MSDAQELFVEFREGGKICVWDFDNGSIPYARKDLLDIAIARAEAAEAKALELAMRIISTDAQAMDALDAQNAAEAELAEMVIAKDIHQKHRAINDARAEKAEAEVARLQVKLKAADELARRVQMQRENAPMRPDFVFGALVAYRAALKQESETND